MMMMFLLGLIEEMSKWCSDTATRSDPQLLRFMAHLVLFFRALGLRENVSFDIAQHYIFTESLL